ncbi:hypothetical protein HZ326_15606 [Fusarium oxysporum f. sp. albedinis]|nr:hypothetical protein HZ326_15606 [Fusarium oxysporum f. sp. albedinis]
MGVRALHGHWTGEFLLSLKASRPTYGCSCLGERKGHVTFLSPSPSRVHHVTQLFIHPSKTPFRSPFNSDVNQQQYLRVYQNRFYDFIKATQDSKLSHLLNMICRASQQSFILVGDLAIIGLSSSRVARESGQVYWNFFPLGCLCQHNTHRWLDAQPSYVRGILLTASSADRIR